jgi:hypothetical protein
MKLSQYQIDAINRGYSWECACGEIHRTLHNAKLCRKCRQYLVDFLDRSDPVNLSTLIEKG